MCMKTPKPKTVEQKPPQYLRNPYLDGLRIGSTMGRNSLRINRNGARPTSPNSTLSPNSGTAGRGGGSGDNAAGPGPYGGGSGGGGGVGFPTIPAYRQPVNPYGALVIPSTNIR